MEGGSVTFCCEAKGKPVPVYSWFHNGVLVQELISRNLRLSSISSRDSGTYKCSAKNEHGETVSSKAELTVVPGDRDDSCNPSPTKKVMLLPEGCTEDSSGSNLINVGTCSSEVCVKRNQRQARSCRGQDSTRQCCSPASMSDSRVSCKSGIKFNIRIVSKCACADCAVSKINFRGKIVDPEGNPLQWGEMTVSNDQGNKYYTDRRGNFNILVKSGTKRIVLTVKDKLQGLLQDTTKVFEVHEEQVSFYTIVLQKKPPAIKFPANKKKNIPLGGSAGRPKFVDLDIPANAFLTADGRVYNGEITATIGVIDPRSQADMMAAPGDFSAINDNGEEVTLGSVGMLRQAFTDNNGNQLSLSKNISVRIDAEQLDIPNGVTVHQWYLSKETGRWVKIEELRPKYGSGSRLRRQARKYFVTNITPNVPYDNINWDYVSVASYVRIRATPGTVVTRIGLSNNGLQYTSYRQGTVPASGILCILSLRNRQAILQAERDGVPLIPRQPIGFPLAVNPQIIDRSPVGTIFKIQSFRFTSTKVDNRGPIYLKGEQGRCAQSGANDVAFEFQDAAPGQLFHWQSVRIQDPNDSRRWRVRPNEICYVKALVTGSNPDSVIYVRSIGKAPGQPDLDYGYTAEKSSIIGGQGVVCLEYRCNEGPLVPYQTHLQFLTLTGTCTVQSLNNVLVGLQNRCSVSPAGSSSQERNFCVPDLVGGAAALYSGSTGVAKNRCLTGNQLYNSGRPTTTNRSPTVTFTCS
ncbi:cartilage intermediate layer protein 1-like [Stylophora pistillata]|uniref:cartilage intermediate layer protein 1-like n=1 Tax=Stylophora pistillata TaxID=50429 RepID=UPI000C03905C|nr:cartilage intermediate layer protein 1-like [Stylophora pistillata]